jgi:hypothetical protein
LQNFLLEDAPANLAAQLVFYQSEEINNETKNRLEQYFLKYGSLAIGLTLGIPSEEEGISIIKDSVNSTPTMQSMEKILSAGKGEGVAGTTSANSTPEKISDYKQGMQLAKLLWGEPLASLMVDNLTGVRSLDKSAQDVVLASMLPLDSIRAGMFKMLKKRAIDGPKALEAAGWNDKTFTDPGLLVLLEMLPRSKTSKSSALSGPGAANRIPARKPTGAQMGGSGPSSKAEEAQKKAQSDADWLVTISNLSTTWCTRLDSAGQLQKKKAARKGQKAVDSAPTRPDEFELPRDAKIVTAYQLNWPDNISTDSTDLKPSMLKIQFLRLQQTGTIIKTIAAYKRLTKGGDIRDLTSGIGQWLEAAVKNGSQPKTKRSLDIFVTRADKQHVDLNQKEEPSDLLVDILAIEINDPTTIKE